MPKPKNMDLIKLGKVPAILKELTGVTRTRATIYNWTKKGRIDTCGQMIKLRAYKRLGQIYTTNAAIMEFLKGIG